jgi:hypothetical protein
LLFVPAVAVGARGVPVRVGDADNTTDPEPVDVVTPVPPLATFSVPAKVMAPVVAVEGVKPVDPAENDDTPDAPTAAWTNAVVASCPVFVPGDAVGADGTPVKVGLAILAFKFKLVMVAYVRPASLCVRYINAALACDK